MDDTRPRTPFLAELGTICEPRCGKVRDLYDLGERMLVVTSDRISSFDWVLPCTIPDKGRVLQMVTDFWRERLDLTTDVITTTITAMPGQDARLGGLTRYLESLTGRVVLVRKLNVVPLECVVRGYLDGSGWSEYQASGTVCGLKLPGGLTRCAMLGAPIFTPTTKEATGHDKPVDRAAAVNHLTAWLGQTVGRDPNNGAWAADIYQRLLERSIDVYSRGDGFAGTKGLLIADTKFEWALVGVGEELPRRDAYELVLVDEVLTPDSSRYWPADQYEPGHAQPSFDKQSVRDWLIDDGGWDKNSPPPRPPDDVIGQARERYIELYQRLSGDQFPWK